MKTVTEIVVPQLAESLVSATIDKWLKQPGDQVELYEPICEMITDKVNAELPSTLKGTLVKILVGEGETVPVGTPVCLIETEDVQAAPQAAGSGSAGAAGSDNAGGISAAGNPALAEAAQGLRSGAAAGTGVTAAFSDDAPMRGRYSPAVQQLAAEHGINLAQVSGTGIGGRITRKDVLAFIAAGGASGAAGAQPPVQAQPQQSFQAQQPQVSQPQPQQAVQQTASAQHPAAAQPDNGGGEARMAVRSTGLHLGETPRIPRIDIEAQQIPGRGEYFIDVTPIRNAIARNMRQSVTEIPHGWMMIEVDVTNLVLLRNKLKDEFMKREGVNLTYLAFFIKAVVNAIKDFPIINSVWAVDKIIVKRDINISLAVGTEDAVKTPVIRNAEHKTISGLAREIDDLARKTRDGKLTLADMDGGTFTVNNTGSFGSVLTQPIINYPQAAIITFESIVKRPVVINDMIAVRSMANVCLSLDHRILDGVICGRFLQRVKETMESFNLDTKLY